MSLIRLADGRIYEMRETAEEMFRLLSEKPYEPGVFVYLVVRQPGRAHGRYKGMVVQQGLIASIEDDGLGHAAEQSPLDAIREAAQIPAGPGRFA